MNRQGQLLALFVASLLVAASTPWATARADGPTPPPAPDPMLPVACAEMPGPACAKEAPPACLTPTQTSCEPAYHLGWAPESLQITAGLRTWFSWGQADDTIFFSDGSASEFRFDDVDSLVYELNLDAVVGDQFVAHVDVGFGVIDEGSFVSAVSPGPSATPIDIDDDDLFYVSFDVGYRLLNGVDPSGRRWILDAIGGYQYWRETYVPAAFGLAQFENRYTWNSFRLGSRAILETPGWRLQARALTVPWMHFRSENIDPLTGTTDYVIKADGAMTDGAFGVMADVTFSLRVCRELFVEVGYQIFHLESASGTFHQGIDELPFDKAHSTRHGVIVGVNWRF